MNRFLPFPTVQRCSHKSHLGRKMHDHLFSLEVKYSYQRYCPLVLWKSKWGNLQKNALGLNSWILGELDFSFLLSSCYPLTWLQQLFLFLKYNFLLFDHTYLNLRSSNWRRLQLSCCPIHHNSLHYQTAWSQWVLSLQGCPHPRLSPEALNQSAKDKGMQINYRTYSRII